MSTQNIEKEQTSTRDAIFTVAMFVFLIVMTGVMIGYFAWTLYGDKEVSAQSEFEYFVTHCKVNDGGSVICTDEV